MIDHKDFRYTPVPWCKPGCPLSWPERLVYGCLVHYHGRPRSARELAAMVGLSRPAVRSALEGTRGGRPGLRGRGLAALGDAGWDSLEPVGPAAGWFVPRAAEGAPWHGRIAYWPCCLPSEANTLTTTAVGLCWLAVAMERDPRPTTAAGLAKFLGVRAETVAAAIERLAELGVLSWTRGAGGKTRSDVTFSDPLPVAWSSWWVPRHREEPQAPRGAPTRPSAARMKRPDGPAVMPAFEATPTNQSAIRPGHDSPGLPPWMRHQWLDAAEQVNIPARDQQTILGLVERLDAANSDIGGTQLEAAEYVRAARDKHNPDKAKGRRDCGGLVINRLTKLVKETEQDRCGRDRRAAGQDLVWAPLRSFGLGSRSWPCRSCGEPGSWEMSYQETPEHRWPEEVRELAAALRQLEGVRGWDVSVGPAGTRCSSCGAVEPGLILRCRRELLVGRSPVSVLGYRAFPDAVPAAEPVPEDPASAAAVPSPVSTAPPVFHEQDVLQTSPPAVIEEGFWNAGTTPRDTASCPAAIPVDPAARRKEVLAPLAEIGLRERPRVRCDACGLEWVPEPDYAEEDLWPPPVREVASRIRAIDATDLLLCGPPQRGCDGCSAPWSGLVLRCRRKVDRVAVFGLLAFPGARLLDGPAEPAPDARPAGAPVAEVIAALGRGLA